MRQLLRSFKYAFNGLRQMLFVERNFTIHIGAAFLAVVLSVLLDASDIEFVVVIICIAMVISLEIINSAIEKLCNFIEPGQNEKIKLIKDMSAAGVLVAAIAAFVIGLIIFLPKLIGLF